jgi:hypothetical protein
VFNDFRAAFSRLRSTLWGGGARLPEQVAEAVTRSGFSDVRVRPVGGTMQTVLARRPACLGPLVRCWSHGNPYINRRLFEACVND